MLVPPKKRVTGERGKIALNVFCNRQCPWCGWMVDRIKRNVMSARRKYSDVTINVINTDKRDVIEQFGVARGVFIDGEPVIKRMALWKEIKSALDRFAERNVHS